MSLKVRVVTNTSGTYTDVWLDGKYTRFPYLVQPQEAARQIEATRRRLANQTK